MQQSLHIPGELKGVSTGKAASAFTKFKKIDFEVVQKMLEGTYLPTRHICG